jgi:glycerol-3-phosphate dehydrogenase
VAKTYNGWFVIRIVISSLSMFFFLLKGTTDTPCEITDYPSPSTADVDFILGEVKNYLSSDVQVRRGDVLAAWSGIRPLVLNPNKKDTQSIARNHIIHVSNSGLVTIGGKNHKIFIFKFVFTYFF